LKNAQLALEHKFGRFPFSFATFKKVLLLVVHIPYALKDNINILVPSEILHQLFNDGRCYLGLLLH
jgi:hypothetical protein